MPTSNENFFTRERMQAIGLGIGRGFQSYDPNNPFASAGAAMEATIGAEMGFEARDRSRKEHLDDLAAVEKKQIEAEKRAEEASIRQDERALKQAQKMGDITTEIMLDRQRKQRADEKAWRENQEVVGISHGLRTKRPYSLNNAMEFAKWFAHTMGGGHPRFKGNSPISLYDERTMSEPQAPRSRGMMRTPDGRMVKAIEDSDQTTPIFGEGGRDYAN